MSEKKKIAIACQGGGSHTAFTAGVLCGLLKNKHFRDQYTITALSGTSGGAVCAAIVWAHLLPDLDPDQASEPDPPAAAAAALEAFWKDTSADDRCLFQPWLGWNFENAAFNRSMVNAMRVWPFAESQCGVLSRLTGYRMETLLKRHIPHDLLHNKDHHKAPWLRLGATDIRAGRSQPLAAEECQDIDELHRRVLASASIPPLFDPTVIDGRFYWDGLYSHNPPLECLTNLPSSERNKKRDGRLQEIWIIQINPAHCSRVPRTAAELVDRRNELMGNLTLYSEMFHIDVFNCLLEMFKHNAPVNKALTAIYQPIIMRLVELGGEDLDFASKYDRSIDQVNFLMDHGETAAAEFFDDKKSVWPKAHRPMHGVHEAYPDYPAHEQGHGIAEVPGPAFCSTINCPAIGVCNTYLGIPGMAKQMFEQAQAVLDPCQAGHRASKKRPAHPRARP